MATELLEAAEDAYEAHEAECHRLYLDDDDDDDTCGANAPAILTRERWA